MSRAKRTPLERVLGLVKQEPVRLAVARLVPEAGLGRDGDDVQAYVATCMLHHLDACGYDGRRYRKTSPPRSCAGYVGELARRRAWELVTEHHQRLPAIDYRTAPHEGARA